MLKKIRPSQNTSRTDDTALLFCVVLAFSLILFFFRLGDRPFRNPDEGRYAAIAKHMLDSGDWGVPRLFGLTYLKKPILFYWLLAGSFKLFGANEWTARSIPALFGVLGVAGVFGFCLREFDKKTAFYASLMLASNFWYLQVARYLITDMVFSFFLVASVFSFYRAHVSHDKVSKNYYLLFFLFLALAFITKGPIAMLVVGTSLFTYLLWTRQLGRVLATIPWGRGLFLFGVVALPWYIWMASREPQFLNLFFGHENWNRVFSSNFEHQEPFYFYFLIMIPILAPWILFWKPLLKSWRHVADAKSNQDPDLFLILCGFVTMLCFSIAKAKLATYILPSVVFIVIPLARGWKAWIEESESGSLRGQSWPVSVILLSGILLIVLSPWYVLERNAGKYPGQIAHDFQMLGGLLLAGGVFSAKSLQRGRRERFFYSLIAVMAGISLLFPFAMETMNPAYSTKAFAASLSGDIGSADEVYVYDQPGAFYDFSFYLGHPVKLVGLEGEMEFSRSDQNASRVAISREQFNADIKAGKKIYCLMRKSDFIDLAPDIRDHLVVIRQDQRKVLFKSNDRPGGLE